MSIWYDVMYDHLTSKHTPEPGSYEEYYASSQAEVFEHVMRYLGWNLAIAGALALARHLGRMQGIAEMAVNAPAPRQGDPRVCQPPNFF